MKKQSVISVFLLCSSLFAIPYSTSAKKGGGGKPSGDEGPGNGYALLTEEPAMLYSAKVTNNKLATVFSNADGSAKQALQYQGDYFDGTSGEFVVGQQAFVCSWQQQLVKVDYSVDTTAGIVIDSVTVLDAKPEGEPDSYSFTVKDTSPDGQWVVYDKPQTPGGFAFKKINDSDLPFSVAFHPDSSLAMWNIVWLDTPNLLAVSYMVKEDNHRKELVVFRYDPNSPELAPVRVTAPYLLPQTSGSEKINYAVVTDPNWTDGVVTSIPISVGTAKVKGRIVELFEWIVHQLEFDLLGSGNPASFYPIGPVGSEVQGFLPAYSQGGQFIAATTPAQDAIIVTDVTTGDYVLFEADQADRPDWNPNW